MNKPGLGARFFSDWPAKVLSLAAALLLFFFNRLNQLEERYLSVPLSLTVNDEYLPASHVPKSVRLTLKGESNAIFSILEDDLRAVVDLSGQREEGPIKAAVAIEKRGSALGVDPLEILVEPAEIVVTIERRVSKVVPVTPSFRGYLEPGYELVSFEMSPPEVEIAGPASAVARAVDISTDFIELSGKKADFSARARLQRKDPLIMILSADTVDFVAAVQEAIAFKSFQGVEIAAEGLPPELSPSEPLPAASLRLQGTRAELRDFSLSPASVYVDLSELRRPGTYTVPVQVRLPDGFALDSLEPKELSLRLVQASGGDR